MNDDMCKLSAIVPLTVLLVVTGCSSKRISSSVQDQSMKVREMPISRAVETAPTPHAQPRTTDDAASPAPIPMPNDAPPTQPAVERSAASAVPETERVAPPRREEQITDMPVALPVAPPLPPSVVADLPVGTRAADRLPSPSVATLQTDVAAQEVSGDLHDLYFDYDKALIRDDARAMLEQNARLLAGRPVKSLTIEGHCDERGTLDYNLVLGERRARAVKRYLEALGVRTPMTTTSYGKERPRCQDHTEQCWQQNRRVHFVGQ